MNEHVLMLTLNTAYRTNEGKPWVLPVVRDEEVAMAADESLNHEYLTILGLPAFSEASNQMLLGADLYGRLNEAGKLLGIQCLSGTGSIRVGADFLAKLLGFKSVLYSDPSWRKYFQLFQCP